MEIHRDSLAGVLILKIIRRAILLRQAFHFEEEVAEADFALDFAAEAILLRKSLMAWSSAACSFRFSAFRKL